MKFSISWNFGAILLKYQIWLAYLRLCRIMIMIRNRIIKTEVPPRDTYKILICPSRCCWLCLASFKHLHGVGGMRITRVLVIASLCVEIFICWDCSVNIVLFDDQLPRKEDVCLTNVWLVFIILTVSLSFSNSVESLKEAVVLTTSSLDWWLVKMVVWRKFGCWVDVMDE
jgi:hypothetical protein